MSETRGTLARRVAHHVLVRVERDRAYADRALEAALKRTPLTTRDRALASELCYGALRHQRHLDFVLGRLATRELSTLSCEVKAALRLGAYQILHTRIPPRAAVFESVALVGRRPAAGFVNAVLRKLVTLKDAGALPTPSATLSDPIECLASEGSHPEWLLRELWPRLGERETRALVAANNERPGLSLRVNLLRTTREALALSLRAAGCSVSLPELFPHALIVQAGGDVRALPGFAAGHFTVQDAAAQLIAVLASPAPGDVVLDACAAPGGKATHVAELMRDQGAVVAVDVHRGRARLIDENARRLGLTSVHVHVADASDVEALGAVLAEHGRTEVDAALVDAPCSGQGTLRRNPELRLHEREGVALLAKLQDHLLDSVARVVRPGGALVYAVCTVTEEEGPARIAELLRRRPEYHLELPPDPVIAPFVEQSALGPVVKTWPHRHPSDGFFAARLVRR